MDYDDNNDNYDKAVYVNGIAIITQKQTDTSTVALGTITISLMESTTEEISRRGEVVSSSQYGSEDSRKCGAEESLLFKTKVIFKKKRYHYYGCYYCYYYHHHYYYY